ncbi:equilibrative nucleoside transporter 3 [Anolis carolinensis]|uniref:Solute carrier family 29 member 3 n=1 Tax=Anolis carolinensis TaxID=28377 RepID=G1KRZ2_ANOCA|nr:PREDICTED: equilibrative nucleoside transporter 3 [Anolis carolinensis]|eukprot:XP_008104839.1 PREDICTED: equilibrative nucleoside transporter 3 [Anolis carolinensis]
MAVDFEDNDCDDHHDVYQPANTTIQDETPLLEEPPEKRSDIHKPEDRFNGTYIIFFFLGTSSLLPLGFIMTAKPYWIYKLQNCSEQISSAEQGALDIRDFFESYISVASTVPSVLCLIGNFLLVNKVSVSVRILSSLVTMLAVLMVITALVKVDTSAWTPWFFIVIIVCVVISSSAATIFSSSIFGLSGCFPMRNSQALISGQAMGGTLSAVASVVDLAAASEVTDSALAYFLTADVFIIVCIGMYLILPKLEYASYYIKRKKDITQSPCILPTDYVEEEVVVTSNTSHFPLNRDYTGSVPPLWSILKKISTLGFCVFYIYFISIMIFPAVSSSIESVNKVSGGLWTDKYFTPLTSFLLYNFADLCGRQITAWIQVPGPKSWLLPTMALLRTIFIPIFMLCNYQPRMHSARVIFAHDIYPVVFTALLGFSNGYLITLSTIYGPKVTPKELSEAAGVLMMMFMQLGLALGAGFSVLVVHLI